MEHEGSFLRQRYINRFNEVSGDTGIVKVVTGMRCVGKTVATRQFAELYSDSKGFKVLDYDFDGMFGYSMKDASNVRRRILEDCDGNGKTLVLLHEFHKLDGWMGVLEELVPLAVGEFFLTASDDGVLDLRKSKVLSRSFVEIRMFPMTLREYMDCNGLEEPGSAFETYIRTGGLPIVRASYPPEMVQTVLNGVLATALLKDVLPYSKGIRSDQALMVAKHVIMESGKILDQSLISESVGSFSRSRHVYDAMAGCFLLIRNDSRSIVSRLKKNNLVYYATDVGLRNCLADYRPDRFCLGENILVIELKRLGYSLKVIGDRNSKTFIASDDVGKTEYSFCEGRPPSAGTGNTVRLGLDLVYEPNDHSLISFLLQ